MEKDILSIFNSQFNDCCIFCDKQIEKYKQHCYDCNITYWHFISYNNIKLLSSIRFCSYNLEIVKYETVIGSYYDDFPRKNILVLPISYLPTVYSHYKNNSIPKLIETIRLLM